MFAMFLALIGFGYAGAAVVEPVIVPEFTGCDEGSSELVIDYADLGTQTYMLPDGVNWVSITITKADEGCNGYMFDWSSSVGVYKVFVDGGEQADGNLYTYDSGAYEDTGLRAPFEPDSPCLYCVSNIIFCYSSIERDGCTRSQGYWKTHSEYGPAPYDSTWAELEAGADTPFYLSEQHYLTVLWTPPIRGNAYYILAHQFIAAQLNILSGAPAPVAVQEAMTAAESLFISYTPAEIGALAGNNDTRQMFIDLAWTLGSYNEGGLGVPHCE